MSLPPEIEEVRQRLLYETPFWARHCATILTPTKEPVRLRARPWQARTPDTPAHVIPLDEALEKQRKAGQPQRAIILKARKLGFSTWVQAKFMQRASQFPYQYALSIAHNRGGAGVLYDMASMMWERLPTDAQLGELIYGVGCNRSAPFSVKPERLNKGESRNGARWMVLGDRMRRSEQSIYETLTAGAKGGGRASTPSMIHGSEVAHWDDPDYLEGAMNALPLVPGTIAVMESTARGFNHFHDMWVNAVAGAQDPLTGVTWTPLFYGWQDNPANAVEFLSAETRDRFERTIGDKDGGGDDEEQELLESFGVTLEQLAWRRAIRDGPECRGNIEKFHQEHPATPEQAFIGSGTPVFSGILVARAIKAAELAPKPVEGVLRVEDWKTRRTRSGTVRVPTEVLWVPGSLQTPADQEAWGVREQLLVWEHPLNAVTQQGLPSEKRKPDGQYVIFADIAQGTDTTSGERDWTAVQVLDHVTRMQVARYRSRIAVHDLPLVLFCIGLYFNTAWLAPEVNGPGQGVIDVLAKDLHYPRLYRRHRRGDDQRPDVAGTLLGWLTTGPTKVLMEQSFGEALKDGTHGLRDVATGREATTYVEDEKNRHGAQKGTNDDLLMAFMGAHRVAAELRPKAPRKKGGERRRRALDDITGY